MPLLRALLFATLLAPLVLAHPNDLGEWSEPACASREDRVLGELACHPIASVARLAQTSERESSMVILAPDEGQTILVASAQSRPISQGTGSLLVVAADVRTNERIWTTTLPVPGCSLVLAGHALDAARNRAYFLTTSHCGATVAWTFFALDIAHGNVAWRVDGAPGEDAAAFAWTPERIFFVGHDDSWTAFAHAVGTIDGAHQWTWRGQASFSAATATPAALYVAGFRSLAAFDPATGDLTWFRSDPGLEGQSLWASIPTGRLIAFGGHRVLIFDMAEGTLLASHDLQASPIDGALAADGARFYHQSTPGSADRIVTGALDVWTGVELWRREGFEGQALLGANPFVAGVGLTMSTERAEVYSLGAREGGGLVLRAYSTSGVLHWVSRWSADELDHYPTDITKRDDDLLIAMAMEQTPNTLAFDPGVLRIDVR